MDSRFRVTGHTETSAPNDQRSKVPNIHITTTLESQIRLRFALRSAVFELQASLRTCVPNDPKMTVQRIPIYVLQLPLSHKFQNFTPSRSMASRFRVTGYLETFK